MPKTITKKSKTKFASFRTIGHRLKSLRLTRGKSVDWCRNFFRASEKTWLAMEAGDTALVERMTLRQAAAFCRKIRYPIDRLVVA